MEYQRHEDVKVSGERRQAVGVRRRDGKDAFRYFLIRDMTPSRDADFSEEFLPSRYGSTLANDLGNLVHRLTNMIVQYYDGVVPETHGEGDELREHCTRLVTKVFDNLDAFSVDGALRDVEDAVKRINRYVNQGAPWVEFKNGNHATVGRILYDASEALRLVSVLLHPVMPEKTEELWRHLGWIPDGDLSDSHVWGRLRSGSKVTLDSPLFPKSAVDVASSRWSPPQSLCSPW